MARLPYDAGLSAAAETLVGILKRVIVSPAFTRAFLKSPSSRGLSAIAELLVSCASVKRWSSVLFWSCLSVCLSIITGKNSDQILIQLDDRNVCSGGPLKLWDFGDVWPGLLHWERNCLSVVALVQLSGIHIMLPSWLWTFRLYTLSTCDTVWRQQFHTNSEECVHTRVHHVLRISCQDFVQFLDADPLTVDLEIA